MTRAAGMTHPLCRRTRVPNSQGELGARPAPGADAPREGVDYCFFCGATNTGPHGRSYRLLSADRVAEESDIDP